jgi:ATP-dependent RNA helicase DDX46/PRP5
MPEKEGDQEQETGQGRDREAGAVGYFERQRRMAARKELPAVDHSQLEYEPIRKTFYQESSDLAELPQAEIESFRRENGGIKVRGK